MSSSMSPPQRPAPPFSPPYQGNGVTPSNTTPYGQPPAKRQRLSPNPRSPPSNSPGYNTPAQSQHVGLVTSAYGNPYAPQNSQVTQSPQSYSSSHQASFHTPQPYPVSQMAWQPQNGTPASAHTSTTNLMRQSSPPSQQSREMMPPPPRPNREDRDEKVGVEEIGDSLYGSGINLKDEENYMHSVYNNRHAGESFSTAQNASFGNSTASPNTSFNMLTQDTSFGSQSADGAFAGTLGRPQSQEAFEIEQRRKRETAARTRAERMQHHLNNQFLLCNNVRKRMDLVARNHGVMLNVGGVFVRQPETTVGMNGSSSGGIAAVDERVRGVKHDDRPESTVTQGVPFEHVLALLSLAAGERIRGLIDESFALSRARRYGDHGIVVPPEFSDIAEGEGKQHDTPVLPENISKSSWDKIAASSPQDGSVKGEQANSAQNTQPQRSLSFQGNLNSSLHALAERDRQAEKDRVKRREARKRAADAAANGETVMPETTGEPVTSNAPVEAAAPVKLSKKEQAKQQKEKSSMEAQSHNTVNQTAAMMALGRKGNRYSWMSGGAANLPTNRFAKSSTSGTATPSAVKQEGNSPAAGAVAMGRGGSGIGSEPQWGDFREEGADGNGVQLRDWVLVLERDGREKFALQKALLKLS